MDANGMWWDVTIIREHLDGTVACQVNDGFGTQWPITQRQNLREIPGETSTVQVSEELQPEVASTRAKPEATSAEVVVAPKESAAAAALSKVWDVVTGGLFKASEKDPRSQAVAELQGDLTLCHAHVGCKHLGTEGTQCCPTQDGVTLACCYDLSAQPEPVAVAPTGTESQAPAVQSAWTPVGAEHGDLVGRWGYGDGSFDLRLAGGQLRFEETDGRIAGGSASGAFFANAGQGVSSLPTARINAIFANGGVEVAAIRLRRLHGKAAGDKIGIEIMRSGDTTWDQGEIIAARMPAL